jgi:cyclic GMP-AMP synthase
VQFAGSHYDGLRINKPDEFDMDVVIGLPLNLKSDTRNHENSDFVIEPSDAGYIQLKMGTQFLNMMYRDDWETNRECYKWKCDENYLLRSKFTDWFKSIVVKALNQFETKNQLPVFKVDNVEYSIVRSESGPAITLSIINKMTNFKMDVDLVPTLRFPECRWPIAHDYREIPSDCKKDFWMVVPKPDKNNESNVDRSRTWRLALHYQERELMYNTYNLRKAIKLVSVMCSFILFQSLSAYKCPHG